MRSSPRRHSVTAPGSTGEELGPGPAQVPAQENTVRIIRQLAGTSEQTVEALALALDGLNREPPGHSLRVAGYVAAISRQLGVAEDSDDWVAIHRGALLHDVGTIAVPDSILRKPGSLSAAERSEIQHHPDVGFQMLRDIPLLAEAAEIVRSHHERFDGKGYPRGLAGDEIVLGARVFATADAFDAMTSDRPYRKALRPELARDEIIRHSGQQFDPRVVQAFLSVFDRLRADALSGANSQLAA